VIAPGKLQEGETRFSTRIRRIDHRETSPPETRLRDSMQNLERLTSRRLICFIIRDHRAKRIRGQDLCRSEMRPRKRRLPSSRGADQENKRKSRDDQAASTHLGMLMPRSRIPFHSHTTLSRRAIVLWRGWRPPMTGDKIGER
jgi:hypothetical protein